MMTTSSKQRLAVHDAQVEFAAQTQHSSLRLALAGGGTGGHLLPGIHVLESAMDSGVLGAPSGIRLEDVLWFSSGRPVENAVFGPFLKRLASIQSAPKFTRIPLSLEGAHGGAPARIALGLRSLPAVRRARAALIAAGSEVVLGLGGFTTLPVVLAAKSLGIPAALLEINSKSGAATRWLAPLSARVFHAWRGTLPTGRSARSGSTQESKHLWTGPPLSPAFKDAPATEESRLEAKRGLGLDPNRPLLAVLGGSQGAGGLNSFMRSHLADFSAAGIQIIHQVGPGRLAEAAEPSPNCCYRPVEFVGDVATLLSAADLVLARGGASTLAEIAAKRSPTVVVPYPHHADRHQECNARELGSGVRLAAESTLTRGAALELIRLAGSEGRSERLKMSQELAERLPEPDAAGRILKELCLLAGKNNPRVSSQSPSS